METTFWFLCFLVTYTYVGYPLLLAFLSSGHSRTSVAANDLPTISIIVAAFNEEKDIATKLRFLLEIDYPADRREIIVASDCSTDRTHEIVEEFASDVELVILPERGGKTAAQNMAAAEATGDILVFTDATTEFAPGAIPALVAAFGDARTGCAGARLEYRSRAGTAVGSGGGLYWRYEKKIKEMESDVNSLIGVSGCLYAVRRSLYKPIAADLISDMVIALDTWLSGHVSVYVHDSIAYEDTHEVADKEFSMRSRVVVRSINALLRRAELLNPFRHKFFSLQLWSHKVLRYLVPVFMLLVLLLNIFLVMNPSSNATIYQLTLSVQLLVYGVVPLLYAFCQHFGVKSRFLSAPFYFLLANAAAMWGLISYLRGVRAVTWTTVR
ncbi:MAG: glycosyltransferase [Gammaproteobacteria bacterium]|nr:glycosyltransferase [Gammaproteobacteria bacterium]